MSITTRVRARNKRKQYTFTMLPEHRQLLNDLVMRDPELVTGSASEYLSALIARRSGELSDD